MNECVVVACRSEAKIFERYNPNENLRLSKILTNRKGRYKEREFEIDENRMSYSNLSANSLPQAMECKHQRAEGIARHFAKQISDFVERAVIDKKFTKLTVFAGAHFLGILESALSRLNKDLQIAFVSKNIEKADADQIADHMV